MFLLGVIWAFFVVSRPTPPPSKRTQGEKTATNPRLIHGYPGLIRVRPQTLGQRFAYTTVRSEQQQGATLHHFEMNFLIFVRFFLGQEPGGDP